MDQGYYRQPTIAGERIAFVCEDDLWTVPAGGGTARRITASFGSCALPRLSPDGSRIAFVSNDEGNPEIYVMPSDGGTPRRLTFLGSSMVSTAGWSADGKEIYFVANPSAWYERETRAMAVPGDGGPVREFRLGHARSFSFGANGGMVVGRNADDPARWKRYRGGTAGEIWIDAHASGDFERLKLPDGNPTWPMWIGDRIFFLADHQGVGNLYSSALDGGGVLRHTHEGDYYARFPSTDGSRIAYGAGGELSVYDVASNQTARLTIATHSAAPQTVRRFEPASETLEHFAPNPDGTGLAFVSRGQAFTMPFFDGAPVRHGSGSRARYRLTEWLKGGKRFVAVTDEGGFEQIAVHRADANAEPKFVTSGDIGRVTELIVSPADDAVAFTNHRHELCVVDLDDGKPRVLDKSPAPPHRGHRLLTRRAVHRVHLVAGQRYVDRPRRSREIG